MMNARVRQRAVALAVALLVFTLEAACAASSPPPPEARAVLDIGLTVDDLERSVDFFTRVLGFERLTTVESAGPEVEAITGVFGARVRIARLRLGQETLELTDYLTPRGAPYPYDTRANDHWFQHIAIVVSDMDAAYEKLRAAGVEHASTGPQTLPATNRAAAGIRAFYFRDPDGHFLELIQFPAGKGDARWQSSGNLFLGIDHTAIVVSATARALAFYRDSLGFREAGHSENFGSEQEHLNNVEHARLRITTLRASAGPGIELLEYLSPSDGRPSKPRRSNDLAFWNTRVEVLHAGGKSPALRVRDPDGHTLELVPAR